MVKKEEPQGNGNGNADLEYAQLLSKPGQRYPTPTPGVAERIFYETLYQQRPDSPMAQEYCVAYGILPDEEAAKIHKLVQARKAGGKSAIYSPSPVKKGGAANGNGKKKAAAAPPKKRTKKTKLDDDVPVDTGLAEAGDEGVGTLAFS